MHLLIVLDHGDLVVVRAIGRPAAGDSNRNVLPQKVSSARSQLRQSIHEFPEAAGQGSRVKCGTGSSACAGGVLNGDHGGNIPAARSVHRDGGNHATYYG